MVALTWLVEGRGKRRFLSVLQMPSFGHRSIWPRYLPLHRESTCIGSAAYQSAERVLFISMDDRRQSAAADRT
jgi:hypothetical protein